VKDTLLTIFLLAALAMPGLANATLAKATFAGGCFWCMEPPFDKLDGVVSTTSGYIGGHTKNPTYESVSAGGTGHAEAVEISFDPARISYAKLLEVFWRNIDPTVSNRQFATSAASTGARFSITMRISAARLKHPAPRLPGRNRFPSPS
jgi:peptide-methionine (S)-S-oxide reductase